MGKQGYEVSVRHSHTRCLYRGFVRQGCAGVCELIANEPCVRVRVFKKEALTEIPWPACSKRRVKGSSDELRM